MDVAPGKHPVIVFLHGCGGPNPLNIFYDLGAIVVAPDSFARKVTCNPDQKYMESFTKTRFAEMAFAEEKIKAAAWADTDKMILAGFSHGALMITIYPGTEFKGRVIISFNCKDPDHPERNNVIPGTEPVLTILGTADEFFAPSKAGDCGEALKGRKGSQSVLVEGGVHEILAFPKAREAVAGFIPPLIK
ncbi:MAG: dienelactone hydrolase family protein [Xanthobacteraceae bacterium]